MFECMHTQALYRVDTGIYDEALDDFGKDADDFM